MQGLAEGAVEFARRGLRGAGAPLAASSIARLKAGWQLADAAFKRRPLRDLEVGDLSVDGGTSKPAWSGTRRTCWWPSAPGAMAARWC